MVDGHRVMKTMEAKGKICVLWQDKPLSVIKGIGQLVQKMNMEMQSPTIATWQQTTHLAEASSNS